MLLLSAFVLAFTMQGAEINEAQPPKPLTILYPFDGTIFPPEIVPPAFRWSDRSASDHWRIVFEFPGAQNVKIYQSPVPAWTPDAKDWEFIKQRARGQTARVTISGYCGVKALNILSKGEISISVSRDEVGASLFFREVDLPLMEAAKNPAQIRWRSGPVSSPGPAPVVMEKLPFCGNCHSFSRDGTTLGMDIDYPTKGGYAILPISRELAITKKELINWDDFNRQGKTFGLLSQISPDGQVAASTVNDRSVFYLKAELAYSQLFFPIEGILAIYHRETGAFQALPGADDPAFVQSNPVWSSDGKYIVFARSQAYPVKDFTDRQELDRALFHDFLEGGKPFLYDLYRIPYNDGRGGRPEPLAGASLNGFSNFFPKYSPDGKWIVFCRARSYMMLQADSELYLIPAAGGVARRLRGNTSGMNSWHSWSPNSRWLVFSSKANSPYTQMFLTHIDVEGNSSPPVSLAYMGDPERAANIPEFVSGPASSMTAIRGEFAHDQAWVNSGNEFYKAGEVDEAILAYQKALAINPQQVAARQHLGLLLFHVKEQRQAGLAHLEEALRLAPRIAYLHHDLAMALLHQGKVDPALPHFAKALDLMFDSGNEFSQYDPNDSLFKLGFFLSPRHRRNRMINPVPEMEFHWGLALFLKADYAESAAHLHQAISFSGPRHDARFRYLLAMALTGQGKCQAAMEHYARALELKPDIGASLMLPDLLGANCALTGQFRATINTLEKKLQRSMQLALDN